MAVFVGLKPCPKCGHWWSVHLLEPYGCLGEDGKPCGCGGIDLPPMEAKIEPDKEKPDLTRKKKDGDQPDSDDASSDDKDGRRRRTA